MGIGRKESELLNKQPRIRQALEEASGKGHDKKNFTRSEKNKILIFLLIIFFSLVIQYLLLREKMIQIPEGYKVYLSKFVGSLIAIAILLLLVNLLRIF